MDQKRRKQFYGNNSNKKRRIYNVEPGLKGFICSCNNREKDCIREAYNLLNKYADKLYKPAEEAFTSEKANASIEDDLTSEIEQLKSETAAPEKKRFQVVESGARNFLFIRTTLENPFAVATAVIDDLIENPQQQTKFLLRLIPIEFTCKAYVDDIRDAMSPLIDKYFTKPQTFSIIYNHRNNNSLSKDKVIDAVAESVTKLEKGHTVDLTNPDITILIEVIKGFAFLAVVPNYKKYKKFNMQAFCETEKSDASMGDGKAFNDHKETRDESEAACEEEKVEAVQVENEEKGKVCNKGEKATTVCKEKAETLVAN